MQAHAAYGHVSIGRGIALRNVRFRGSQHVRRRVLRRTCERRRRKGASGHQSNVNSRPHGNCLYSCSRCAVGADTSGPKPIQPSAPPVPQLKGKLRMTALESEVSTSQISMSSPEELLTSAARQAAILGPISIDLSEKPKKRHCRKASESSRRKCVSSLALGQKKIGSIASNGHIGTLSTVSPAAGFCSNEVT